MDLNNIKREGTWKEIAENLNDNFNKISVGMDDLSNIDVSSLVHIGSDEPNGNVLWADPNDSILSEEDNVELSEIRSALIELQNQFEDLKRLQTVGIIPGNSKSGYREILMASATPEEPKKEENNITSTLSTEENPEGENDEDKPDTSFATNTVTCICAKMDTASNFTINKQDLIDGELIFYTDRLKFAVYYGGKFYTSGSGDGGSGGGEGISVDDLYQISLERLNFTNGTDQYRVTVNDKGKWIVRQYKDTTTNVGNPDDTWGNYVSQYLCMNSIYVGGDADENCSCTHNYIELANASNNDINLRGLHLLYTDGSKANSSDIGYNWDVLDLEGVINAGSTFVIRGGECNDPKNALINVDNYDIIWYKNGEPIRFNQGPSSFYLCVGDDYKTLLEQKILNNPWQSNSTRIGYIDSCGFGTGSVGEGSATFTVNEDWNKLLFVRWYMLDPSKQGNKAYSSRKTTDLWTYINIDTQTTRQGNSIQYYYSDEIKQKYTPMASYLGKTFFTNKTRFNEKHANYINITFGIQATDNGVDGATRCFNWVSVGNFDEYVEYKLVGDTNWTRSYSITDKNSSNPDWITKYIDQYKRFRWCGSDGTWVTTHKTIIKGLTKGSYEYRIGRDNDINYTSEILTFKVESDEDVENFSFIHISDQQGFNWAEYTAWWKSSYVINRDETNFNFFINTGDITQSGNRPNEWLDYYTGKRLNIDKCEMFSIGNNDLCGHVSTELTNGEDATSKYSHINVLRYFCFELDPNNDVNFQWGDNGTYPIYSLYSFNYGKYHFISLNSEIAIATSKMYKDWQSDSYSGDRTFAEDANAHIEEWLKKDLQIWKKTSEEPTNCGKCIIYMHEMPFTIVTWDFMKGESARVGSHLNTLNANGLYRFSRLFKKYGIRLVIGGHKHTYSISKPIYDAPSEYIVNNTASNDIDLMGEVGTAESRVPVIQVTREQDVKESNYARYEIVSKINAPTYVMSQATGYKLVSNKEQPSGPEFTIPWLLSYFKAKTNASSPTENVKQHYPMYIKYDVTDTSIKVTAKQVQNIWNVNVDNNSKKFDMNNQLINTSSTSMTLSQISDEDKSAYGITDIDSLTINL